MEKFAFKKALPVWAKNRQQEMNMTMGYTAIVDKSDKVTISIAGSSVYNVYVNGEFVFAGPVRCAHGFYRVQEYDITEYCKNDKNNVSIEIVGYNINGFYTLNQPSFLQTEIECDGIVTNATGVCGFTARELTHRVQKVQKYSFQRTFVEYYRLSPEFDAWRKTTEASSDFVEIAVQEQKSLVKAGLVMSGFGKKYLAKLEREGSFEIDKNQPMWQDRSIANVTDNRDHEFKDLIWKSGVPVNPEVSIILGYPADKWELAVEKMASELVTKTSNKTDAPAPSSFTLSNGDFKILSLKKEYTGLLNFTFKCKEASKLIITFEEILTEEGEINHTRSACVNVIGFELQKGEYRFTNIEPYSFKYIKFAAVQGQIEISDFSLTEFANAKFEPVEFKTDNVAIDEIFAAACENFRQNATDIYMDCPSRERAGWLCDSYFTGKAENYLCASSDVEKNFLEHFIMPEHFPKIKKKMLPMCYPSDHYTNEFIPNWCLWYVLQLEEYLHRTGDRKLVDDSKQVVYNILEYFQSYENDEGVLEDLEDWVFLEWSKANELVDGVNYPTNMTYVEVLQSIARMYGDSKLTDKADALKQKILSDSFNGEYFVDMALRENGKLKLTDDITEICQYYAMAFDIASPQSHPQFWDTMLTKFGGGKICQGVHKANAFIGSFLRMLALSKNGYTKELLDHIEKYFLRMAKLTGTLWELDSPTASCNHGFTSYVAVAIINHVCGIVDVDHVNKKIVINTQHILDNDINECTIYLPIKDGKLRYSWTKKNGVIEFDIGDNSGYSIKGI